MTSIILINLTFYALIAYFRPQIALLFLIFALPTYLIRFDAFSIPFTLLECMILISFIIWLLRNFTKIFKSLKNKFVKRAKYPFHYEIIAIIIISYLAVAISNFSIPALGIWKAYFFEPLLLYILIINYFPHKNDWKKIIWSLSLSALVVSLVAIFQQITGTYIFNPFWADKVSRRVVSVFGYPNAIGLYLAPIIMLSISLLISSAKSIKTIRNKIKSLILLIIIGTSFLAIYFARSEGALIALAISIFLYFFFFNKKTKITISIISIVAIIIVLFTPSLYSFAKEKILLQDKSGQIRKAQWHETWQMLGDDANWITGAGLAKYQAVILPYHQEGIFIKDYNDPDWLRKTLFNTNFRESVWQPLEIYLYPHNIILNFWVELGLLGMLIFIFLYIKIYIRSFYYLFKSDQRWRPLLLSVIGAITTMIIHGIVDVPYFKNDLSAMFWIIVALLSLVIIHNRNNEKRTPNKNNS